MKTMLRKEFVHPAWRRTPYTREEITGVFRKTVTTVTGEHDTPIPLEDIIAELKQFCTTLGPERIISVNECVDRPVWAGHDEKRWFIVYYWADIAE
jgi:hypothetical protein